MNSSLTIIAFFAVGVVIGNLDLPLFNTIGNDLSTWVLYLLMGLVGLSIGSDRATIRQLRNLSPKVLFVPAATIIGTLAGVALISPLVTDRTITESLMVGSGFGYYSLSSVLITKSSGAALGTVALMSNVTRELITLLFTPLIVRYFGPIAPICTGGATTIDTTLPIIVKFSGKEFIFVAIINGIIVDFSTPILVTLFSMF